MGKTALMIALVPLIAGANAHPIQVVSRDPPAAMQDRSVPVPGNVYRVTGRVIDDVTSKPLGGAKVTLTVVTVVARCVGCGVQSTPPRPEAPRVTLTDIDGQFEFDAVPEKLVDVRASKAGYLDVVRPRIGTGTPSVVKLTSDRHFVLRLAPAASISGIARDHAGLPLEKNGNIALCEVTYWAGWPQTQYVGWPRREPDGTYHFENLEPGRYFLVVSPPWNRPDPERTEGDRAVGEVPVRYPAATLQNPSTFFTLHEGEQKKLDLQLREETLHHVTLTATPAPVLQVFSASGGTYSLHRQYESQTITLADLHKGMFEAWLPDGIYWPTNGRPGEIDGPIPFKVAGADVSGLHFDSAAMGTTRLQATVQTSIDGSPDLKCGPSLPGLCWTASLYLLYLSPERSAGVAASVQLTTSTKPIATTLLPGHYAAVVLPQRNLYAKSIRSGTMDFSQGPIVIHQAEPPAPIEVELAEAGKVDGIVQREGQPVPAYVYALPVDDTAPDYRLFTPVNSKDDGTFEMEGLAPGPWVIFATDTELNLNVHDPLDTGYYWRDHGSVVDVQAGHLTHIVLEETPTPER